MSVTGPGCAHCDYTGSVTTVDDRRPCDYCGGLSQFAPAPMLFRAPSHETDWRPLPAVAEVLAHNARVGGDCFGPWLAVDDLSDDVSDVRVMWLCVAETRATNDPDPRVEDDNGQPMTPAIGGAVRVRPITRRGEALPWPEVPR